MIKFFKKHKLRLNLKQFTIITGCALAITIFVIRIINTYAGIDNSQPDNESGSNSVSWRNYTNNDYLFSLYYPSNWIFNEYPEEAVYAPLMDLSNCWGGSEVCSSIFIDAKFGTNAEYEELKKARAADANLFTDPSTQKIAGTDAFATERLIKNSEGSYIGRSISYLIKKEDKLYFIEYGESAEDYGSSIPNYQHINEFNNIISTFQLLDKPTMDPSWKTTTSNEVGIKISYPPDFTARYNNENYALTITNNSARNYIQLTFAPDFQEPACKNAPCNLYQKILLNVGDDQVIEHQIWPHENNYFTFKTATPYPKPPNKKVSLTILGRYSNESALQNINDILSTFKFAN